ncbi:MAG: hypothetical protein IJU44_03155 [Kiritimatiellae bacterium]|nr:hypothetical protein [Kiritimatiellia bacterium]
MFRKFINLFLIALIVLILAYIAKDFFAGSDGGDEDSPRRDGRTAVAKPAKRDGTSRRTDVKPMARKTAKRVAAGDAQAMEPDGGSSTDSEPGEEDEQDLVIKAVREWETQVDDWVREDNREPLASRGKKAKAAIAKVPESERMVAIQTLLNLLPDESFAMMEPILMDPKENPELVDAVFSDMLNRPEEIKNGYLVKIAKMRDHPSFTDAAHICNVTELNDGNVAQPKNGEDTADE